MELNGIVEFNFILLWEQFSKMKKIGTQPYTGSVFWEEMIHSYSRKLCLKLLDEV